MKHLEQLKELSNEYLVPRYQKLVETMAQPDFQRTLQQERKQVINRINEMLVKLENLQKAGAKESLKGIQLSFLHSANISGTYEYELECITGNIYDEAPVRDYWTPAFLYQYLDEDKSFFRSIAKKKIIRIPDYEIEEFLRSYSLLYFEITGMFFLSAVRPTLFELNTFQRLQKEPEVMVLLGGHMDKVVVLHTYHEEAPDE